MVFIEKIEGLYLDIIHQKAIQGNDMHICVILYYMSKLHVNLFLRKGELRWFLKI